MRAFNRTQALTTKHRVPLAAAAILLGMVVTTAAQVRQEIPGERLARITPIYEGWAPNRDGTFTLSFGYLNRTNETIEVPLGPDNFFQPAPADRGQPTRFLPGRQQDVVTIIVPAGFEGNVMWTVAYDGWKTSTSERGGLNPAYLMTDPQPTIDAGEDQTIDVSSTAHLEAFVRAEGLREGMQLKFLWTMVSGPGAVTFTAPESPKTDARFSVPGLYILRFAAGLAGSDLQTRSELRVTVTP
jgi:hypothetical protein